MKNKPEKPIEAEEPDIKSEQKKPVEEPEVKQKMLIKDLDIKPEYKNLIPRPCKEDLLALRESIEEKGIIEPVIINKEDAVIDGHTRIDIAKGLGIEEVPVEIKKFDTKRDELEYIFDINYLRRHLKSAQKISVALHVLRVEQVARKGEKSDVSKLLTKENKKSRDIIADRFGVSNKSLQEGLKVEKLIEELDDKQLKTDWEKAKNGEKTFVSVVSTMRKLEGKPIKKVDFGIQILKEVSKFSEKIKDWKPAKINKIKDDDNRENLVQSIKLMYETLGKLMQKIVPDETDNINIPDDAGSATVTESIQAMERKKEASKEAKPSA